MLKKWEKWNKFSLFNVIDNRDLIKALYSKSVIGYFSTIDLPNDKLFLINSEKETENIFTSGKYCYFELSTITDFLDMINNMLSKELNMDFIALYPSNNTIISPGLCTNFMIKQSNDLFNEEKLNKEYNKIIRGSSGLDACFYDKKILENQKIKEMFSADISHFLNSSSIIYQGLINLNEPYFFMKYSIPHLNTLMEFRTDYSKTSVPLKHKLQNFLKCGNRSIFIIIKKKKKNNDFYIVIIL